jgi:hypothetical protein
MGIMGYRTPNIDRIAREGAELGLVSEFLKTFAQFPPRQKPASFSVDQALEKARESEQHLAAAYGGGVK